MIFYKKYPMLPKEIINIGKIDTSIKHKHLTVGKSYTKEDYYYTEEVYSSFSYNFSFTNRTEYVVIEDFFNLQLGKLNNFWGRTFKNTFEMYNLLGLGSKINVKYSEQHKLLDYGYIFIYLPDYDFATRVLAAERKTDLNGVDIYTEFTLENTPPAVAMDLKIEPILYGHFNTDTLTVQYDDINIGMVTLPFVENVPTQYKIDLELA